MLKVRQPIGDFYISSMAAKDLVEISYSDVRRLAQDERDLEKYLGIQRPVNPKRIKAIKKYIAGEDATFPTSIILSIDEKCAEYESLEDGIGRLTLKEYSADPSGEDEDISYSKIAKVIDGQHRIAAFMDENDNWSFEFDNRAFDINVALFIGADVSEQANIFATVNLAQTKVNKSLVYDLTELARTPSPHKTCHNVAVALDKEPTSPLHQRIKRLGTATPGRKNEPLTQASFVESLVRFISPDPTHDRNELLAGRKIRLANSIELKNYPFRNLFLEDREVDISEIIYNYFKAVEKKWPQSWGATDKVGNILPRSNAFKALMVYLRVDIYPSITKNTVDNVPSVEDFFNSLNHIDLKDNDFTTKNFSPGSAGQSAFLKMLRGELSLDDMVD